jgi:hypothetical protein
MTTRTKPATRKPKKRICAHPKEKRTLLYGYDVYCGDCCETVGRVALFPCAVLSPAEARALLNDLSSHVGDEARSKLEAVAA